MNEDEQEMETILMAWSALSSGVSKKDESVMLTVMTGMASLSSETVWNCHYPLKWLFSIMKYLALLALIQGL